MSAARGDTSTSFLMSVLTSPDSSATPTPTMATMMTPTALKLMKFCTTEVNMKRTPSAVSRLRAVLVACSTWSVSGFTTW